jgi:hypothetical protein
MIGICLLAISAEAIPSCAALAAIGLFPGIRLASVPSNLYGFAMPSTKAYL